MTQKVIKVGSSAAVVIPKKSLEELGMKIGDLISVEVDRRKGTALLKPAQELSKADRKIAELTFSFIQRYRKDLEALARR